MRYLFLMIFAVTSLIAKAQYVFNNGDAEMGVDIKNDTAFIAIRLIGAGNIYIPKDSSCEAPFQLQYPCTQNISIGLTGHTEYCYCKNLLCISSGDTYVFKYPIGNDMEGLLINLGYERTEGSPDCSFSKMNDIFNAKINHWKSGFTVDIPLCR